jgi:hypothetical protein
VETPAAEGTTLLTNQAPAAEGVETIDAELGMKFRTSTPGQITAIRFYKMPAENPSHTGKIWNLAGTQLAWVTFQNETGSGWQEQPLPTPLSIYPGTTYIVSVNDSNHRFPYTRYGLSSQIVNGPLSSVADGSNGVYQAVHVFPNLAYLSTNYFRDVRFKAAATTSAPVITFFAADPAAITAGQSSVLSWQVTGATTLSIDNGVGVVTGTDRVTVSPVQTSTYTLTAANSADSATKSVTVVVQAPPNQVPAGSLDGVTPDGVVFGSAWDPDNMGVPVTVSLYFDRNAGSAGASAIPVTAAENRTGVGNHAFSYLVPAQLRDGLAHQVWAWGIDLADTTGAPNAQLANSPKAFTLPDAVKPVVSVTAPAGGATVAGVVNIVAAASDNIGVAGVRFQLDGANLGTEDTVPPYAYTLDTTTLVNGSHVISAVARDAAGNTAGASVTVTVNNVAVPLPSTAALAAAWSFDDADMTSTAALDRSGNGYDAVRYGATSIPGRIGQALLFIGTNSFLDAGAAPGAELNQDLTIAAWVRTTNNTRWEAVLAKYGLSGMESGYMLRVQPNGRVNLRIGGTLLSNPYDSSLRAIPDAGSKAVNDGLWHHVAVVVRLGQDVTFYCDGALSSVVPAKVKAGNSGASLLVGKSPWYDYGYGFTGSLDEVRIYRAALSAADVAALARIP